MRRIEARTGPTAAERRLWVLWLTANAAGELVGFGIPAFVTFLFAVPSGDAVGSDAAAALATLLAGGPEGFVLGSAQSVVLRSALPRVPRGLWRLATVVGAVAAWELGLFAGDRVAPAVWELGLWAAISFALIMLVLLGGLLGLAQWWVLRRIYGDVAGWIPANVLGWALGLFVPFSAVGFVEPGDPLLQVAAVIAITGALMGALVGGVTGVYLVRLSRRATTTTEGTRVG